MHLTSSHIAAVMAVGIRFTLATPDQVQRLSMQRRVFRIDGDPYLATRDGSFFETAATLERLIAADPVDDEQQQADLAAWEASGTAAPPIAQPVLDVRPSLSTKQSAAVPETPALRAAEPAPAFVAAETAAIVTPQRRSRHKHPPVWMTAGAERRGRVDQHWSARARR